MKDERWTIINEAGAQFIEFTSFISADIRNEGQVLSYPIEEGGFASYNKVQSPLDIEVVLAVQGENSAFSDIISALNAFQKDAVKLTIVTPQSIYGPVTLETYSHKHTQDDGANLLTVTLGFIEVREVKTMVSTTVAVKRPRNPTSAPNENTGKKQSKSVLAYAQSGELTQEIAKIFGR